MSSAGPNEFGTITVIAAVMLFEAIFLTISECAAAENCLPPYSFAITKPKKPLSFMNFHVFLSKS